jgi:hypothetical protein
MLAALCAALLVALYFLNARTETRNVRHRAALFGSRTSTRESFDDAAPDPGATAPSTATPDSSIPTPEADAARKPELQPLTRQSSGAPPETNEPPPDAPSFGADGTRLPDANAIGSEGSVPGQLLTNPFVCKVGDKKLYVDPNSKQCRLIDKQLYTDLKNKFCKVGSKALYVSADARYCHIEQRYDLMKDAPSKLREELQLLDARRHEIAGKLKIDLDVGLKVGCKKDDDCNILNIGLTSKSACRSDNTCACAPGASGAFCQHHTNYADPNDMTPQERRRFMRTEDLRSFTVRDYINWLMLYNRSVDKLSYDHVLNFKRLLAGEDIKAAQIPRLRVSPPTSALEYAKRITGVHQELDNGLKDTDKQRPLAYNWSDYDNIPTPAEVLGVRVIDSDALAKKTMKQIEKVMYPQLDASRKAAPSTTGPRKA